MLSACLLFIYGVDGGDRPQQAARESRFTTWRRTPSQARPHLGAETVVARPRCGRRWEQMQARHVPDSPKGMGIGLGGWGGGREMRSLKGRGQNRNIKGWWRLCRKALSAALRGLKAQQVRSPGQRPGCHVPQSLRPVRAKVKANRSPILLPLQGVGVYTLIPRALPWAVNWLPFQGAPFRALFVSHVGYDTPQKKRRRQRFRPLSPA